VLVMKLKTFLGLALVGATAAIAAPASAALTLYTDRAAFEAAIAGDPLGERTITFGALQAATIAADPLDNGFLGAPGLATVGGDTFTTASSDNLLFAVAANPGSFNVPHLEVATDGDFTASLTIVTAGGVNFIGFDVGAWIGDFAPTPLLVTINGQPFDVGPIGAPAEFIGFTSTASDIQSVTLSGHGPVGPGITQGSMIDLLDVSQPVPEPASWALMLLGFGGLAAILRRVRERPAPGLA
jgi:hypothetical protein